jgi:hypothetical protein
MQRRVGVFGSLFRDDILGSWTCGCVAGRTTTQRAGQLHSGQHETSFRMSCSCPFAARRWNACLGHKAASTVVVKQLLMASFPTRQTDGCFVSRELGNSGSGCVKLILQCFARTATRLLCGTMLRAYRSVSSLQAGASQARGMRRCAAAG